ncbi:hypothetical protein V5799_032945 [Amblyomma americanum]|uniref:M13 family peptidase n=1 Tax=Amblyomma americanum TaxID=6943 RepID=A0AAQ4DPQ6_AMBAM
MQHEPEVTYDCSSYPPAETRQGQTGSELLMTRTVSSSNKKLEDFAVQYPSGSRRTPAVSRAQHAPEVPFDSSANPTTETVPPASSSMSPTGTRRLAAKATSKKPSSAQEEHSYSNRNMLPGDAATGRPASEANTERESDVANVLHRDPSVVFYRPETRIFTACKQATHLPLSFEPPLPQSQLPEEPPLPQKQSSPLPSRRQPSAVRSPGSETKMALSSRSADVASPRSFAIGFPATKKRPSSTPRRAEAPAVAPARAVGAAPSSEQEDAASVYLEKSSSDKVRVKTSAGKGQSSSIARSRALVAQFTSGRKLTSARHEELAYTRKTSGAVSLDSSVKTASSATKVQHTTPPPLNYHELLMQAGRSARSRPSGEVTLKDMAESFKDKNWMKEAAENEPSPPRTTATEPVEVHAEEQVGYTDRIFYPVAFCVLLAFMLIFMIVLWPLEWDSSQKKLRVCSSASCVRNAHYMDNLLSWEDSPCDDFYSFVCRRWTSQFAASSTGDFVSADDDYAAYLEGRVHAFVQEKPGPLSELHAKCMNFRRTNDEGWEAFLQLLFQVSLEGFPLTPPIRKTISAWKTAAQLLRRTGTSALLGVSIASHPSKDGTDLVSVGLPDMLTSGAGHVDINDAVRLYNAAVFAAMKALRKEFVPPAYALSVVKFATDIEHLSELKPSIGSYRLDAVSEQPALSEFLTEVFAGTPNDVSVGTRSEVLIETPQIVDKILKLAKDTEVHTVLNYLCVRLMIQTSAFIPESQLTDFYATLAYGKRRGALARWELCARVTDKALFPIVSASLLAQLKTPVSTYASLTGDSVAAFQRAADASPYLDASSKDAVRSLMGNLQLHVLGPEWVRDAGLVEAYARNLPNVTNKNGLETYTVVHEYTFLDSLARGSAQRWRRSTFAPDCWYEPHPNTLYVPFLAFNVSQPFVESADPLQLAREGPRVGKCLFDMLMLQLETDETSKESPAVGTATQGGWLTAETRAKLMDVEACLEGNQVPVVSGFSRFRDVLALRAAYNHFRESRKKSSEPRSLRLANQRVLTDDQLFFVFVVLQMCEKTGTNRLRTEAGHDWLVALRNSDDFSSSYNCSRGDAMNPHRKCTA